MNMLKKTFLIIFFILRSINLLYSQGYEFSLNLPKNNKKVVVLIQSEKLVNGATYYQSIGTGFWFGTDRWNYIVTAKHVIINPETKDFYYDKIKVLYSFEGCNEEIPGVYFIDLEKALKDNGIIYSSNRDILAIRIYKPLGNGIEVPDGVEPLFNNIKGCNRKIIRVVKSSCKKYDEIEETADIIFFGFPSSLERFSNLFRREIQYEPESPLYRKGIIAGKNKKNKTLIIDGEVYEGNSGGPVILIEINSSKLPMRKEYRIIGLITQFIPYVSISKNEKNLPTNINIQNAGYSVVEPIDNVFELINKYEITEAK